MWMSSSEDEFKSLVDLTVDELLSNQSARYQVVTPLIVTGLEQQQEESSKQPTATREEEEAAFGEQPEKESTNVKKSERKTMATSPTIKFDLNKLNIELFDGSDYPTWKWKLENFFEHAGLTKVITEETAVATKDQKTMVNLVLSQSMTTGQLLHVMNLDSPYLQWKALMDIHDHSSADRTKQLMAEFFSTKMKSDEDVSAFISRMKDLQSKLKQLDQEIKSELLIASVLGKLPKRFDSFVEYWNLSSSGKETIEQLHSKLLQTDQRQMSGGSDDPANKGQALNTRGLSKSSANKNRKRGGQSRNGVTCYYCGEVGHIRSECTELKEDTESGNVHKNKAGPKESNSKKNHGKSSGPQRVEALVLTQALAIAANSGPAWFADSGASDHICPVKEWFTDLKLEKEPSMSTATGDDAPVLGRGTIKILSCGLKIELREVLFVPSITNCLLSISKAESRGVKFTFSNGTVRCYDTVGLVATGKRSEGGMYVMDFKVLTCHQEADPSRANQLQAKPSLELWHRRLAHCNLRKVQRAVEWKDPLPNGFSCVGCLKGKAHRQPYPSDGKQRKDNPGDLVHLDICGAIKPQSLSGASYFLLLKDDCTGFMFFFAMKKKSDTFYWFKKFLVEWGNVSKNRVKRLRSDNGTEFLSNEFKQFLEENKIGHELTTPYCPSSNGYIERSNRTVNEAATAMIHDAGLPEYLWAEACNTAVHIFNRIPLGETNKSPMELVTGRKPKINHVRVFGSRAFVHLRGENRNKFGAKSKGLILVGYEPGSKSYRCFDLTSRKLTITRDIEFIEPKAAIDIGWTSKDLLSSEETVARDPSNSEERIESVVVEPQVESSDHVSSSESGLIVPVPSSSSSHGAPSDLAVSSQNSATGSQAGKKNAVPSEPVKRSARIEKLPVPNYSGQRSRYPFAPTANLVQKELPCPESYKQAIVSPESNDWIAAMEGEMTHMEEKDVRELVDKEQEVIFMSQPERFKSRLKEKVCKLKKSFYGLTRAPRACNTKLTSVLLTCRLNQSLTDPSLFISKEKDLWIAWTKRIDVKYKLIRCRLEDKVIKVTFVRTELQ